MPKIERHYIRELKEGNYRNLSIVKDADGNNVVVINDIIFKGRHYVDWDEVETYLRKYVGEFFEVASTGDIIYIGSDLPNEFSHSSYNAKLKGALLKSKANAAQDLGGLIEIATNRLFRDNLKAKHNRDAANGWYKYDSRYALPVYDNNGDLVRYNVFYASLIVRWDIDGKLYLYDIINIKKETGEPALLSK